MTGAETPRADRADKQLVLVLGGARSGKSAFAQWLAKTLGRAVTFVATAEARDEEMRRRIEKHRRSRPRHWRTVEAPLRAAEVVREEAQRADVVLLDCLTLFIANLTGHESNGCDEEEQRIARALDTLFEGYATGRATMIVVSNEVGMGVVPAYPLGRRYRDLLGAANQRLARAADRVYSMTAGLALEIKASGLTQPWKPSDDQA